MRNSLPSHGSSHPDHEEYGTQAQWANSRGYWAVTRSQQGINTGHTDEPPRAMFNRGLLEEQQGDPGRARHWYQQATNTGHTEAISRAE